ncbi:MAG: DDE-type integrase/transposase/recombinase [Bacillota bacterium]|nr:DDE-type integrase/transposase/recombinase [Bacillota bacterium]
MINWKNTGKTDRILWVDAYIIYVVDINAMDGMPIAKKISDVLDALEGGNAEKLDYDPLLRTDPDETINEKDRIKRDAAWAIISEIVRFENEPDIYMREKRGPWIRGAVQKYSVTYASVYKYLRRYWQRGKNKNSLLPDYCNSGGKGKSKKLGLKKIGRPRKNIDVNGPGVNVDEDTKKIFRLAIKKYYDIPKENHMTTAYNLMVKEFYNEDYRFEDGIRKPISVQIGQIPTITQFRYWYEVEQDIVKSLKARKGDKKFALNHRVVLGKSDAELIGPGSKYQIDATVADVYLVSRLNRNWIIGRPVIYAVIDVFSRMVAGIYVGLEGPSWIGAMMAMANAFTEKVSFCREYGIEIKNEDWPCFHIPQAILGDRGEMESKYADTLVNGLNIRIENAPSYRADWKGIVEQYFHLVDEQVKPLVPGHIDIDFRTRGGKDYRLHAKLDIYQFTRIIIRCVLEHNNEHWMKSYRPYEMMIEDDVDPIPRELWNWGIVNRSGRLKVYNRDTVKLNLMPGGYATVTGNGIKYKNMYYSCSKAIEEHWFETARNKQSWKESIAFDPRNMNHIYVKTDNRKSFLKCSMIDTRQFGGMTLDEVQNFEEYQKLKLDKNAGRILQSKVNILSAIEDEVAEAEKLALQQRDVSLSNASRTKSIRDRRRQEKEKERLNNAFILGEDKENPEPTKVLQIQEDTSEKYKYPSHIDYLRKKQQERMKK